MSRIPDLDGSSLGPQQLDLPSQVRRLAMAPAGPSAALGHSWLPPSYRPDGSSLDKQSDVQTLARQTARISVLDDLLALFARGFETASDL